MRLRGDRNYAIIWSITCCRRCRYYGVLAPNAPLRAAVTALAPVPVAAPAAGTSDDAPHRTAARYLWAILLARIYGWTNEGLVMCAPK